MDELTSIGEEWCCALDEADERCGQRARWFLIYGPQEGDYLFACETHRGPLERFDGGEILALPLEGMRCRPSM